MGGGREGGWKSRKEDGWREGEGRREGGRREGGRRRREGGREGGKGEEKEGGKWFGIDEVYFSCKSSMYS